MNFRKKSGWPDGVAVQDLCRKRLLYVSFNLLVETFQSLPQILSNNL